MEANEISDILRNATVQVVRYAGIVTQGQREPTRSLDEVLGSLTSVNNPNLPASAKHVMQHRWGFDVDKKFMERLKHRQKQQCFHAEAVMLAHFHRREFRFTQSLPYIGCSKPSCYCCELYAELHPLITAPRESHGNAWVKWALPCPARARRGRYCQACTCILEKMLRCVRKEIRRRILAESSGVHGRPESTTNMSSVVMLGFVDHEFRNNSRAT